MYGVESGGEVQVGLNVEGLTLANPLNPIIFPSVYSRFRPD